MLACFIRNFFILLITIYTYFKLLNLTPNSRYIHIFLCSFSIIISTCTAVLFAHNQPLNWLTILLLFFLIIKFTTKTNLYITYVTSLFSFTLSFIAFNLSGLLSLLILSFLCYENYKIPWTLIRLFGGIIHFILIYYCFRIPRLKKGMTFLYHFPSNSIGSTICMIIIMIIILFGPTTDSSENFILFFYSFSLIFLLFLLYWWDYHLTQIYRKYIQKSELTSLELLLLEKSSELTYYKNEHDRLSSLIHKDNKIIPALTMAVTDFLKNVDTHSKEELKQLGSSLQTQLHLLYDEHIIFLDNCVQKSMPITSTGFASVNGVLMFMQKKATNAGIEFQFLFSNPLNAVIPSVISEKDFSHLLSDLLDNAIIAANAFPSGSIQIHMGIFDKIYTLKVSNTGNPFPIEVLQDLGINRHTTHKDSGGSGIGLMDIWKIKEDYSATLLIDEITASSSETTSTTINILFNKKKHFIIHTDRYKELTRHLNRPDLMILPKE